MSDLENKTEEMKREETQVAKRPYSRVKKVRTKEVAYRSLIRAELADELYDKILNIIVVQKKYKDPDYSAKDLARELNTNTRYLSAVINSRFGMNYSCLLNEYRVKDATHLLVDRRFADKNIEEISAMVGFANRQSFYAAFYKQMNETPHGYRKRNMADEPAKKTAKKKEKPKKKGTGRPVGRPRKETKAAKTPKVGKTGRPVGRPRKTEAKAETND